MSTTDLAELRRLYEAAMCVGSSEMAWDEWVTAISEAADALLDAAAERDELVAAIERQKEGREYLRAERDALRNWSHDLQVELKGAEAQRQMLLAERDALAAAVERVRSLHHEGAPFVIYYGEDQNRCFECGDDWPCPTIRALDEEAQTL